MSTCEIVEKIAKAKKERQNIYVLDRNEEAISSILKKETMSAADIVVLRAVLPTVKNEKVETSDKAVKLAMQINKDYQIYGTFNEIEKAAFEARIKDLYKTMRNDKTTMAKLRTIQIVDVPSKYSSINLNAQDGTLDDISKGIQDAVGAGKIGKTESKLMAKLKSLTNDYNHTLSEQEQDRITDQISKTHKILTGQDLKESIASFVEILLTGKEDGRTNMFPSIFAIHQNDFSKIERDESGNAILGQDGEYVLKAKTKAQIVKEREAGYVSSNIDHLVLTENNTIDSVHSNTMHANQYELASLNDDEISALAVLFGLDGNTVNIPDFLKNSIKINALESLEDIVKATAFEPGSKEFSDMWNIDQTSSDRDDSELKVLEAHQDNAIPKAMIVKSLGSAIYRSLPVRFSKEVDRNMEQRAIVELGLYAVEYMHNVGMLHQVEKPIELNDGKLSHKLLKLNMSMNPQEIAIMKNDVAVGTRVLKPVAKIMSLVSSLQYLDDSGRRKSISAESSESVPDTIRNSFMPVAESVQENIRTMQSKKYKFSSDIEPMYKLWADVSTRDAAYAMAGVLGANSKTIADKIKEVSTNNFARLEIDNMMRDYEKYGSGTTGIEFSFPFDFTVSERYIIDSMTNPQSSKVVRFLITSEDLASTIDVENGKLNESDLVIYKKGIAQAFDLDPDKHTDVVALKELEKYVKISDTGAVEFVQKVTTKKGEESNPFYEAYVALKAFSGSADQDGFFSNSDNTVSNKKQEFIDTMVRATSAGSKFHTVQALMSLIALDKFSKADIKTKAKFETNFSLESDAITSGMILTLMGIGTKSAIEMASKGGVYSKDIIAKWESVYAAFSAVAAKHSLDSFHMLSEKNNNGTSEFKLTHGWLLDFNKHVKDMLDSDINQDIKDELISSLANAVMSTDEKSEMSAMNDAEKAAYMKKAVSNKVKFNDFYNTVATTANEELNVISDALNKEAEAGIVRVLALEAQSQSLAGKDQQAKLKEVEYAKRELKDINERLSLSRFIGSISRALAKPPVMVYIYGSMMSSIRKKIVGDIVAPKIYDLLAGKRVGDMPFGALFEEPDVLVKNIKDDAIENGMLESDAESYAKSAKVLLDKMFDASSEYNANNMAAITFKKYDPIADAIVPVVTSGGAILKNMIIPKGIFAQLNNASDDTLGAAFEKGFEEFHEADQYRESIKTAEVVRFSMFKYEYDKKIRQLISTLSPNAKGEYKIAVADIQRIIDGIEKDGLGHSVDDINGGKQPLYKKDSEEQLYKAILATSTSTSSFSTEGFSYAPNTGASGVITVHSIDGFIDSTSAKLFSLIRIYDGSVSGINRLNESMYHYNATTHEAIGFNTFNSQFNKIAEGIKKLHERGEITAMLDYISNKESNSDRDALIKTLEVLMGYESIHSLEPQVIAAKMQESQDRVLANLDARTENGKPTKLQYGHSYLTDSAKLYHGELTDGSANPLNPSALKAVYGMFGEIVKRLQDYDLMSRYGTTDIKTVGEYSNFSATTEKLTRKVVEDEAIRAKKAGLKAPIFLFGDNLVRRGTGGQAAIRYAVTKNVIGIPTKKNPTMKENAFFNDSDEDFKLATEAIDKAFASIPRDRQVYFPADGLGTGLANLKERSPRIFSYILEKISALYTEMNNGSQPSESAVKSRMSEYQIHSGGAYGADTMFGLIGAKYGMHTYHYKSEKDNRVSQKLKKAGQSATLLTQAEIEEGMTPAVLAANDLGRTMPMKKGDKELLARNWYQIKYIKDVGGAVYAIAEIYKGYTKGGTGYAVAMAVRNKVPVFVFDYTKSSWFKRGESSWIRIDGTPPLTKDFAGIGTRDIESYNIQNDAKQWVQHDRYKGKAVETLVTIAIDKLLAQSVNPSVSSGSESQAQPTGSVSLKVINGLKGNSVLGQNQVNTMRATMKGVMHYGNPFGVTGVNTAATVQNAGTATEVSNRYAGWLNGENDSNIESERRQWILDQIDSGVLDSKELVYYKDTAVNHAKKLVEFINARRNNNAVGGSDSQTKPFNDQHADNVQSVQDIMSDNGISEDKQQKLLDAADKYENKDCPNGM